VVSPLPCDVIAQSHVNILCGSLSHRAVPRFDGFNGIRKRLFQNALADGPEHQSERLSFEVLAFADDIHINVGRALGISCEVVSVSGCAAPKIGIRGRENDVVWGETNRSADVPRCRLILP